MDFEHDRNVFTVRFAVLDGLSYLYFCEHGKHSLNNMGTYGFHMRRHGYGWFPDRLLMGVIFCEYGFLA